MGRPPKIDVDRARCLREQGLSYAKIAEIMGVRKQSVHECLSKPDDSVPAEVYDLAVARAMAHCPARLMGEDRIEQERPVRLRME